MWWLTHQGLLLGVFLIREFLGIFVVSELGKRSNSFPGRFLLSVFNWIVWFFFFSLFYDENMCRTASLRIPLLFWKRTPRLSATPLEQRALVLEDGIFTLVEENLERKASEQMGGVVLVAEILYYHCLARVTGYSVFARGGGPCPESFSHTE